MKNHKQYNISQKQNVLNEYLTLKPNRAVQRLLQQNQLNQCFQLYNLLQQNVKANTNQLRTILYSKHENLHECSQMIQKIEQFANKVKNIQQQIDTCLNSQIQDDDKILNYKGEQNIINQIENLIYDKKFVQALKLCKAVLNGQYQNTNRHQQNYNGYYIQFMKVQVIQKLQKYLKQRQLTSQIINQSVAALRQFMSISSIQQLYEFIQNVNPSSNSQLNVNPFTTQGQTITLLQLLYEKCSQSNQQKTQYPLTQNCIIQVIFKFKLLSIKQSTTINYSNNLNAINKNKTQLLYNKIFTYFSDLLKILNQVKNKQSKTTDKQNSVNQTRNSLEQNSPTYKTNNIQKLYKIFNLNIQKAVSHITELFIIKNNRKLSQQQGQAKSQSNFALSFQTQLYQKLLDSKQFISIIQQLQAHFNQILKVDSVGQIQNEQINIVNIIKNLWKDFYHQMLDIITQKINPSTHYQIPQRTSLPQELSKFTVVQYSKITKQRINQYKKQLDLFMINYSQLLIKSKSIQQKRSITNYYVDLKNKVQSQCHKIISQKMSRIQQLKGLINKQNKRKAQNVVRQLILMYLLIAQYNSQWESQIQKQTKIKQLCFSIDERLNWIDYFSISLFKFNTLQHGSNILFKIVDTYLDIKIFKDGISQVQYIQKWQSQLDIIFATYTPLIQSNLSLQNPLKALILNLIQNKLHSLSSN